MPLIEQNGGWLHPAADEMTGQISVRTGWWPNLFPAPGPLLASSGAHINLQLTCSVILAAAARRAFFSSTAAVLLQSHPGRLFESVTHGRLSVVASVCGRLAARVSRAGAAAQCWGSAGPVSNVSSVTRSGLRLPSPPALLDPGLAVAALLPLGCRC